MNTSISVSLVSDCRSDAVVLTHVNSLKEMLDDSDITGALLQRTTASMLELLSVRGGQ